tara:strand:- start:956 stop:1609 length:654 start_codon:yes stop_codon:yes gene_type:complete
MRAVVIMSGGMDSTTLLYDVINQDYKVTAISFDYNQKHKKELFCATHTCKKLNIKHEVFDLSLLNQIAPSSLTREDWDVPEGHYADEEMKETIVPNRNMVMLSLATSYAINIKADKLFYGAHSGDHDIYPDCRDAFVNSMKESISLSDWHNVELEAPYLTLDKGDIVKKGTILNVDYSMTWTCYKGKRKACGKCGSCVERLEAFNKYSIIDPLVYEL